MAGWFSEKINVYENSSIEENAIESKLLKNNPFTNMIMDEDFQEVTIDFAKGFLDGSTESDSNVSSK